MPYCWALALIQNGKVRVQFPPDPMADCAKM